MRLDLDQPLDLALTLQSGQAFRWRRVTLDTGEWWHGFIANQPVLLRQTTPTSNSIEYLCPPEAKRTTSEAQLRSYFRLDNDLPALYARLAEDKHLARVIAVMPGMRLLRQDPWECLVGFICSGQNNILRIMGMMERMAEKYGEPTELHGIKRNTFPTPQKLAPSGETALRTLGLGFRAGPVAAAAKRVAAGELPLMELRTQSYTQAKDALVALGGVGEKIADCVLLFSLEKGEAFPVDRWVRRAMEDWYRLRPGIGKHGKQLKEASYEQLRGYAQKRWGTNAGYVNQYLFQGRRAEEREVGSMSLVQADTATRPAKK